jgi:hypothetical protein
MEHAAQERWRIQQAARRVDHEAHADKHGIYCPETNVVGASWNSGWSCPHCGYTPN